MKDEEREEDEGEHWGEDGSLFDTEHSLHKALDSLSLTHLLCK